MNAIYRTIIILVFLNYFANELYPQTETCVPILSTGVFNQSDPDAGWKDDLLGTQQPGDCFGATIGNKGCALTTMAMLFRGHNNNTEVNPKNLNTEIFTKQLWYNSCNMWWGRMNEYSLASSDFLFKEKTTFSYQTVKDNIDNNTPMPFGVNINAEGKAGHWVLIYGYTNNCTIGSDIKIYDPAGGISKTLKAFSNDLVASNSNLIIYKNVDAECLPSSPPLHCYNCIEDGDELGPDCGGSCPPCDHSPLYKNTIANQDDVGQENYASGILNIAPNNIITIEEESVLFRSMNRIILKNGVNIIANNSNHKFQIVNSGTKIARGCNPPYCFFAPNVTYRDNGFVITHGDMDYIDSYRFWDSNSNIIEEGDGVSIGHDGKTVLIEPTSSGWAGFQYNILYYRIRAVSCEGDTPEFTGSVIIYDSKNSVVLKSHDLNDSDIEILEQPAIFVYPNPVNNIINIKATDNFDGHFFLIDMQGSILKSDKIDSDLKIDMSKISSGIYTLKFISLDKTIMCFEKIIKL